MDDLVQLEHLDVFLKTVEDESPCGDDLDANNSDELTLIELNIEKADESKEWKALKKDIEKLMKVTKDFRLVASYCRSLLYTENSGIDGLVQGLYLTREYIDKFWECVYPPEDEDDPDEKYADRINAVADMRNGRLLFRGPCCV